MKKGSKRIAELLRQVGEENTPEDSILAHITPEEAALLKRRGGSGHKDPVTGLPHFTDMGEGGPSDSYSGEGDMGDASTGSDSSGSFDLGSFLDSIESVPASPMEGDPLSGLYGESDQQGAYAPIGSVQDLNEAWARSGLTEEEISSRQGMEGRLSDTNAARNEYNAMSALGNFGGWTFNDISGGTNINWGGIANSISDLLNSAPAMGIGSALLGPSYGLAAKGAEVGKNAIAESILGRGYDQTTKSVANSLGTVGGLLGGPTGAVIGGTAGQLAQGNYGNALGGALSYGLNASGLGLGQLAANQAGNPYVGAALGIAGKSAQDYAISQGLNALGIENGMTIGGAASGYSFVGDQGAKDSAPFSTMAVGDSGPGAAASAYPSTSNYSPQSFGGGGMEIGSAYLQKIKDLYKNQTDAFEQQRRKTWYSDGTWEVVK